MKKASIRLLRAFTLLIALTSGSAGLAAPLPEIPEILEVTLPEAVVGAPHDMPLSRQETARIATLFRIEDAVHRMNLSRELPITESTALEVASNTPPGPLRTQLYRVIRAMGTLLKASPKDGRGAEFANQMRRLTDLFRVFQDLRLVRVPQEAIGLHFFADVGAERIASGEAFATLDKGTPNCPRSLLRTLLYFRMKWGGYTQREITETLETAKANGSPLATSQASKAAISGFEPQALVKILYFLQTLPIGLDHERFLIIDMIARYQVLCERAAMRIELAVENGDAQQPGHTEPTIRASAAELRLAAKYQRAIIESLLKLSQSQKGHIELQARLSRIPLGVRAPKPANPRKP